MEQGLWGSFSATPIFQESLWGKISTEGGTEPGNAEGRERGDSLDPSHTTHPAGSVHRSPLEARPWFTPVKGRLTLRDSEPFFPLGPGKGVQGPGGVCCCDVVL